MDTILVVCISTMGSAGASNALAEIAQVLGRAPILADAFTTREIEDGSGTARLIAFGDRLLPGSAPRQPDFRAAVAM